jgi:hypothetical protein
MLIQIVWLKLRLLSWIGFSVVRLSQKISDLHFEIVVKWKNRAHKTYQTRYKNVWATCVNHDFGIANSNLYSDSGRLPYDDASLGLRIKLVNAVIREFAF